MNELSQEAINELITCPKTITEAPRKEMRLDRGSLRNDMKLTSEEGERQFTVFMRSNADFSEDFSIGLVYHPKDQPGSFILLRCQGPHGEFVGTPPPPHPHFLFHMHRAKAENIAAGLRAERGGEATDKYASYRQALHYFLGLIHATNAREYFPDLGQLTFLKGEKP